MVQEKQGRPKEEKRCKGSIGVVTMEKKNSAEKKKVEKGKKIIILEVTKRKAPNDEGPPIKKAGSLGSRSSGWKRK